MGALLRMAAPDTPLLAVAFTAGSVAALGQALIPYYTGRIIDYASIEPNPAAFRATTVRMLAVAAACAVFTGIRGGLFTVAMTRLNVRLRTALFGSLMAQEVGFFDVSRAGEITSRLAADTTTVSDQVRARAGGLWTPVQPQPAARQRCGGGRITHTACSPPPPPLPLPPAGLLKFECDA